MLFLLSVWLTKASGQAGSIDQNFGENGYVKTNFDTYNGRFSSLLPLSDGKIVAIGGVMQHDVEIKRFLSNGDKDPQFGQNGTVILNDAQGFCSAGALQADGKIIVVYGVNAPNTKTLKIVRLMPDGSIDNGFGTNGYTTLNNVGIVEILSDHVHALSNGDIVFVGGADFGTNEIIAVKLKSNGAVDAGFGQNGVLHLPTDEWVDKIRTSLLSPNRIIIAASGQYSNWLTLYSIFENGVKDPSFGVNGKKKLEASEYTIIGGVVAMPDGKIALASSPGQQNGINQVTLTKLNQNGDLDGSFATNGTAKIAMQEPTLATGLALQSDGKFLIGGMSGLGDGEDYIVIRIKPNGNINTSFGNNGIAKTYDIAGNHCATTLALQPNGQLLIGGFSTYGEASMARYITENANGAKETDGPIVGILVSPNPTKYQSQVNFLLAEGSLTTLTLLDVSGKMLWENKAYRPQGQNHEMLPMEGLPAGLYFLKIMASGSVATQKVEKAW